MRPDYEASLNSFQLEAIDKVRSSLKNLVYRQNTEDTIQDHMLNLDIVEGRSAALKYLSCLGEASANLGVRITPRHYRE